MELNYKTLIFKKKEMEQMDFNMAINVIVTGLVGCIFGVILLIVVMMLMGVVMKKKPAKQKASVVTPKAPEKAPAPVQQMQVEDGIEEEVDGYYHRRNKRYDGAVRTVRAKVLL